LLARGMLLKTKLKIEENKMKIEVKNL
jgi:hypothetical protein